MEAETRTGCVLTDHSSYIERNVAALLRDGPITMSAQHDLRTGPFAWVRNAYWREDALAAVSVALVALPLGLGIALASGAPPMSGLIAAIVGGLFTTLVRGSHVAINGPTAGLITVVLGGVEAMGFQHVLGAIVIAGCVQAVMGLLKLGKLTEFFPVSVLHGMLAAIGMIILAKQVHVALGTDTMTYSGLDAFIKIPRSLTMLNPFVTLISAVGLTMLILHPRVQNRIVKAIPSALWVLLVSIPLVFAFNLFQAHEIDLFHRSYHVGPEYLIDVPSDIRASLMFPSFDRIGSVPFWACVIGIVLVGGVETLVSTKAVDKLDPMKRRTDLDRDLTAVGLSTALSGLIGGLPVITVIVRSSVNVNHGARTRWSNFFHGLILLVLVLFFPWLIREIPKAALAAILIYAGYKLAAPKVFRDMARKGWEQLVIFTLTLIACLAFDLLWGIMIGIGVTLLIQLLRSQLKPSTFFRHAIHPDIRTTIEGDSSDVHVRVRGIANFMVIRKLLTALDDLPPTGRAVIDLSQARVVDTTVLELLQEHAERSTAANRLEVVGLDIHAVSSPHPNALHVLKKHAPKRMTSRQIALNRVAEANGHTFHPGISWDVAKLTSFPYFMHGLVEHRSNVMKGTLDQRKVPFEIFDVSYTEGVLMADEEHSLTMAFIRIPGLPAFTFTREEMISWKGNRPFRELGIAQLREHLGRALFGDRAAEDVLQDLADDLVPFLRAQDPHYVCTTGAGVLVHARERLASIEEIVQLESFCAGFTAAVPDRYMPVTDPEPTTPS